MTLIEVWQHLQELLDARAENKTRKMKHDFAFTGFVHCGHCGCMLVGEIKKGQYVYYHGTGNRGKCPEPYARQEVFSGIFAGILQELVIPPQILEWLGDTVLDSDRTERAAREQAIKRLQAQQDQIEARIETMYMDKLEGRISQEFLTGTRPQGGVSRRNCCERSGTSRPPHQRPLSRPSTCSG